VGHGFRAGHTKAWPEKASKHGREEKFIRQECSVNSARLKVQPLDVTFSLKDKVYRALKEAILSMNIYGSAEEIRLDERQLSAQLGVSRTPIREAISRLEQEGFVRIVQRKGVFVVRKTKREIVEMITVWAALEGMAARLITQNATDPEIAELRRMFATFENDELRAHIDEYSESNIRFHHKILQMSKSELIRQLAENLFAHVRAIRCAPSATTAGWSARSLTTCTSSKPWKRGTRTGRSGWCVSTRSIWPAT
jgi:DNA-binding GntR family transcriptional regulator